MVEDGEDCHGLQMPATFHTARIPRTQYLCMISV